jgi:hypothetical protein
MEEVKKEIISMSHITLSEPLIFKIPICSYQKFGFLNGAEPVISHVLLRLVTFLWLISIKHRECYMYRLLSNIQQLRILTTKYIYMLHVILSRKEQQRGDQLQEGGLVDRSLDNRMMSNRILEE